MHGKAASSARWSTAWRILALAAAYWATAQLGLAVRLSGDEVTAVWPPAGVSLAALVLFGLRLWPGVLLGALLVDGPHTPFPAALGTAVAHTVPSVAGALLLRRVKDFTPRLERPVDVLALVVLAAGLATFAGAAMGAAVLTAGGLVTSAETWETLRLWWLAEAVSSTVLAPVLLVFLGPGHPRQRARLEFAGLVTASLLLATLVFGGDIGLPYVVFPAVVAAAWRWHSYGATAATLVIAAIAEFCTANGLGPFTRGTPADNLVLLDVFLVVLSITGLVLGAGAASWRRTQDALTEATRTLETRVSERTDALFADQKRLAEAQALAHIGSWEWDIDSNAVRWSDELYRIYGLDAESFGATYETYLALVHPDDREKVMRAVAHCSETGEPYEFDHRLVRPNGDLRWVHSRGQVLHRSASGQALSLGGTCQDVTARVRDNAARLETEERYRTIVEAAQEGIWTVDADDNTTFVNVRMAEMLGYRPGDMLGRSLSSFMESDDPRTATGRAGWHRRAEAERYESKFVHRDGSVVWCLVSTAPLPRPEGEYLGAIAMISDITDRKRLEAELTRQALHDALTGLPNRLLLNDRLTEALHRARRSRARVAVLFVDVDRFKWINDSLGHDAGDRALVEAAQRLTEVVRPSDTVARFGGDEFVVVCEDVGGIDEAMDVADRLLEAFGEPFVAGETGAGVRLGASVGVALGGPGDDPSHLIRNADSAMYKAKAGGRGRAEPFDAIHRHDVRRRLERASTLDTAPTPASR